MSEPYIPDWIDDNYNGMGNGDEPWYDRDEDDEEWDDERYD